MEAYRNRARQALMPSPIKLPSKKIRRAITLTILNLMWMGTAPLWFRLADLERGYDATGGELLLMALPYLIWLIVETIREMK